MKFSYRMELQFSQPVWQHCFSLMAFPMRLPEQQINDFRWSLQPDTALQFHEDYFGNLVAGGRFDTDHAWFCYEMEGTARLNQLYRKPEVCLPVYRYPSELCRMTMPLQDFLKQCEKTKKTGIDYALHLMECLYSYFQYQKGRTSVATTAGEAFAQKCGVCQDYAHILIALCRASGLAARYVAGMISGEGATHAWVEIYENGMWHGLDPTQNRLVDEGYLKLAQGRDYLDCRLNRGVFCGSAAQEQHVYVNLEEL